MNVKCYFSGQTTHDSSSSVASSISEFVNFSSHVGILILVPGSIENVEILSRKIATTFRREAEVAERTIFIL